MRTVWWRFWRYICTKFSLRSVPDFWAHLCLCTVGSFASLSVRPSITGPKLRRLENNLYLKKHNSWHVSGSDISFDGSKSKCWCHRKSINTAHDEVNWIWCSHVQFILLQVLSCQTPLHLEVCESFLTICLAATCKSVRNGRWAHSNVKLHFLLVSCTPLEQIKSGSMLSSLMYTLIDKSLNEYG